MSRQVQLRRGTTAQSNVFTGAQAELTVDTDQNILILHDGTTVGGHHVGTGSPGPQGIQGIQGLPGTNGINGTNGTNGLSAYQLAVASGYPGTLTQWLTSLASTVPGPAGTNGTNGTDGLSAYQVAVANGFVGTEAEWLTSLASTVPGPEGPPGTTGNVSVTDTTISTVNPNASLVISPNGTGEVHISANVGIENTNPGFSLEVGNAFETESSGDIGFSFYDGTGYGNTASIGWSWYNGIDKGNNQVPPQHAVFGIFKNGTPNMPWLSFDSTTPKNALVFAPITGDAIFTGAVVALRGVKYSTPGSSIGRIGDTTGMTSIDAGYVYVCVGDYDGVTNIWRRSPLSGATW